MMENCHLTKVSHVRPWSVQLAIGAKRNVIEFVANCEISIHDHVTRINLNILPLVSYDMIIGMDWLEKYNVLLNCFDKTFTYVGKDKIVRKVNGFSKPISLRKIYALKLRKCLSKGSNIYGVNIADILLNENLKSIRDHPVLSEFMDVFPEEIPQILPP